MTAPEEPRSTSPGEVSSQPIPSLPPNPSPLPAMPPAMPLPAQSPNYAVPGTQYSSDPYGALPGYPSFPQGGMAPADTFVPPTSRDPRFGRVGRVPWTLRQTLIGTAVTLVPLLTLNLGIYLLPSGSSGSTATLKPLPPLVDLVGGIVALVFTFLLEGVLVVAPLYYAVWRRAPGTTAGDGLRALGFRKTPFAPALAWVVGGTIAALVLETLASLIVQQLHLPLQTNADRLTQQVHYAPFTILFTLIGAVVAAPICEEIFFRGYLFAGLLQGMNVWLATLVSALLFTLVHGDIGSAIPIFIIGLILPVLRWRTGSLWPGVALHMLNNLIAGVTVLAVLLH